MSQTEIDLPSNITVDEGLQIEFLPLEKLNRNGYNPNQMTASQLAAVRESILEHGFISPSTVREHPEKEGEYEIIDSEHRYRVMLDLQDEEPDETWPPSLVALLERGVMPCVNLGKVDDAEAKRLTVKLNQHGTPSTDKMQELLRGLTSEGLSAAQIGRGLMFGEDELNSLLGIVPPPPAITFQDDEDDDLEHRTGAPTDEVDLDDDDELADLPSSHIRMVQLFLNGETQPVFLKRVEALQKALGLESLSEVVYAVVERAFNDLSADEKESDADADG